MQVYISNLASLHLTPHTPMLLGTGGKEISFLDVGSTLLHQQKTLIPP